MTAQVHASEPLADGTPARVLLEALSQMYPMVLAADPQGRVAWWSEAWLSHCGQEPVFLERHLREVLPKLPNPEQAFTILSTLREQGYVLCARVKLPDDTGGDVSIHVSIFPVAGASGSPGHNVVIARPCLGRAPRPESHEVLDSHPDAALMVDTEGFVAYANPAAGRLLAVSPDELQGAAAAVLVCETDEVLRLVHALHNPAPAELQLHVRRAGDEPLAVSVVVAPQRDADGAPRGAVVALRTARDEHQALAELTRRNDELEHCINTLAHDLRSPLVALLGFSRLLRQDYGERLDDTGGHFVDRIEQAGRTMEELIHDLLELSRIGQPGEHPAIVDPRAVLLQVAAELKPRLDADGVQLALPVDPPVVYCDRTRLYQVFSNLIGNALEHMGDCEDPRIVVEIREGPEAHSVTVRDFGRGVAAENHERIFEAFQSLGSRRDGRRGTGMGLAIVRKIAETHGGCAWVESDLGSGAAFHLTLPRH
jgi:PAS domain S-box-containing protein